MTVAPLVNLWRFGPDADAPELPTEDEIEAARKCVGVDRIEVRSNPPALRKTNANVVAKHGLLEPNLTARLGRSASNARWRTSALCSA